MTMMRSRGRGSGPRGKYNLLRWIKGSSRLLGTEFFSVNLLCFVEKKNWFLFSI